MASTIIGGNLKCYHGLDTSDIDEWNAHCSDPENGHTESGTTLCQDCGVSIVFEGIPYHPITKTGKNIQLRCPGCMETYQTKFANSNNFVKVVENPEQGITMSEPDSSKIKDNGVVEDKQDSTLRGRFTLRGGKEQ